MASTNELEPKASKQPLGGGGSPSDLPMLQNHMVEEDGRKIELVNWYLHIPSPCLSTLNFVLKKNRAIGGDLQADLNRPTKKARNASRILRHSSGEDFHEHYDLLNVLGSGTFADTHLCIEKKSGSEYACKVIKKSTLKCSEDKKDVQREVDIMNRLPPHDNLIEFIAAFEDDAKVYLVLELCTGGELIDPTLSGRLYTEVEAATILRDVIQAVKFCHENEIMHRDLKPSNLLYKTNESTSSLKVIDFGLSTFFKPGVPLHEEVGSTLYMAPEVFENNYGKEADIWSAGIILYVLLCGVPPYSIDDAENVEEELEEQIKTDIIDFEDGNWRNISKEAKDLAMGMLDRDPNKRLTVQQILAHPWMVKMEPRDITKEENREKLYHWIVRQHEEGSRVTVSDILARIQHEMDYSSIEVPLSPKTHSQAAAQFANPSFNSPQANLFSQPRMNFPVQSRNAAFSNALSSPVRRSLQSYHIFQGDGYCSNSESQPSTGGQNNSFSCNDSSMDVGL